MNRQIAITVSYFLLRVVTAFLFIQVGGLKMFGWFGGMPPDGSVAHFPSQVWFGGVLEVFGGLAVLLGLLTRPVAFILSGEMAVAYWQFHFPSGTWPIQNHGEMAVLMCFVFLYMAARGGGDWSIDALIGKWRNSNKASGAGG